MDDQRIIGEWGQLKGRVKEQWGHLTDDDLMVMEGRLDNLIGRIREATGESVDAIRAKLHELADKL